MDAPQQRVRTPDFLVLVLAALVTAALPLPWQVAGLGFAVAAIAVGVRGLRLARRVPGREYLIPTLALGITFATLMSLSVAASLLLWSPQLARQECLEQARTITAREACEAEFQDAVGRRLGQLSEP